MHKTSMNPLLVFRGIIKRRCHFARVTLVVMERAQNTIPNLIFTFQSSICTLSLHFLCSIIANWIVIEFHNMTSSYVPSFCRGTSHLIITPWSSCSFSRSWHSVVSLDLKISTSDWWSRKDCWYFSCSSLITFSCWNVLNHNFKILTYKVTVNISINSVYIRRIRTLDTGLAVIISIILLCQLVRHLSLTSSNNNV